jgi:hypothetical protein
MYSRQTSTVNIDRQCTVDKNRKKEQKTNNNQRQQTKVAKDEQHESHHFNRECTRVEG